MNKKVIFGDFVEYNDPTSKLGNYHYCNCFVQDGYEALWMSNSYNPLIYLKDKQDYLFKKKISTAERHELAPDIYGLSAFSWRLYGNYMFCRNPNVVLHQEKYIRPNIARTLRKIGFDRVDTLWISNPKLYWLTNVVQYDRLVYRIADDYSQFKEFPNIARVEEQLIAKADEIYVTSRNLIPKVERLGRTPGYLPNGVQFEHFSRTTGEMPQEFESSFRSKVIYVGAIKYWFDVELMERLAKEVDADIYVIGKVESDLGKLQGLPNVHLLGARPYSSIPAYLKYADVAVIPFKKCAATDAVNPIKLYEYCSAGKAVVTTGMEEVKRMRAPVHVAEDQEDFIQGVRRYLEEGYDPSPLIEFGRNNSWQARYQTTLRDEPDRSAISGKIPAFV